MKENYNNKIAPFKYETTLKRNIPARVKVSFSIRSDFKLAENREFLTLNLKILVLLSVF